MNFPSFPTFNSAHTRRQNFFIPQKAKESYCSSKNVDDHEKKNILPLFYYLLHTVQLTIIRIESRFIGGGSAVRTGQEVPRTDSDMNGEREENLTRHPPRAAGFKHLLIFLPPRT